MCDVKKNKVFEVFKGNNIHRWKVVDHPYFDALCLVRDYCGTYGPMCSELRKEDYEHICGPTTLENAYQDAYIMS